MHLLDSDIGVFWLRGRHLALRDRIQRQAMGTLGITVVSLAELHYGVNRSARRNENLRDLEEYLLRLTVFPFTEPAAITFARLKTELEQAGTRIGEFDLLTASIALVNDATVVTDNVREFSRVPGLRVENWLT